MSCLLVILSHCQLRLRFSLRAFLALTKNRNNSDTQSVIVTMVNEPQTATINVSKSSHEGDLLHLTSNEGMLQKP